MVNIWLHIPTDVQLSSASLPTMSFGRGISSTCAASYTWARVQEIPGDLPCTLKIGVSADFIVGGNEGYQTANNFSTVNQLVIVYQNGAPYVLLADVQAATSSVDFSASTIAINTHCTPISSACNLTFLNGVSIPFNCSNAFFGYPSLFDPTAMQTCSPKGGWTMSFFNDSGLTKPADYSNPVNPIYIGMASIVNVNGDVGHLYNESDIVQVLNGGDAFVPRCNATVYNVSYSFINGFSSNTTELKPPSVNMASIVNAPQQVTQYSLNQFPNGAIHARFSNTPQELADKMALVYSQTALGFAAGLFSPRNKSQRTKSNHVPRCENTASVFLYTHCT